MGRSTIATSVFLLLYNAYAQTLTTTNAAGNTIVEVATTNPLGGATTEILQTITVSTNSPDMQQGPVGQPPTTTNGTPGGPTPFTYTTTNANGEYTAVVATFTPSFPTTISPTPLSTGTVLDYSEWLSIIGTNTPQPAKASAIRQFPSSSLAWLGVVGGVVWGALIVLPLIV